MRANEIRTICAWCGKHLAGPKNAPPERTSHCICAECEAREFPEEATRCLGSVSF